MNLDTRLLAYLVYGIGTVIVYGAVLYQRRRAWRLYHDGRARRDLLSGIALFLTAFATMLATTLVLFGQLATDVRGLLIAMALGAFFANGLVELSVQRHAIDRQADGRPKARP